MHIYENVSRCIANEMNNTLLLDFSTDKVMKAMGTLKA